MKNKIIKAVYINYIQYDLQKSLDAINNREGTSFTLDDITGYHVNYGKINIQLGGNYYEYIDEQEVDGVLNPDIKRPDFIRTIDEEGNEDYINNNTTEPIDDIDGTIKNLL